MPTGSALKIFGFALQKKYILKIIIQYISEIRSINNVFTGNLHAQEKGTRR